MFVFDKNIKFEQDICPTCDGTGIIYPNTEFISTSPVECPTCRGYGMIEIVSVKKPKKK